MDSRRPSKLGHPDITSTLRVALPWQAISLMNPRGGSLSKVTEVTTHGPGWCPSRKKHHTRDHNLSEWRVLTAIPGAEMALPCRSDIWTRPRVLDATDTKKRLDRSPVIHGGVRLTDMIKVGFEVEDRRWVNDAIEHVVHEFRNVHARGGDTAA